MPRIIDFGPPYGQVSYPDDATDQQIVADYDSIKAGTGGSAASLHDYYKQGFGSLGRGFTDTLATVPEGAATLGTIIGRRMPGGLLGAVPPFAYPARALEAAGVEREDLTKPLAD